MFLPPVVPGVPPGPQHHPTLPAGRGVTPRAPRHLCRHRNVVQSSNLSHHTHFGASLPLTSTPTVSCTTGASHQNLHVSDRRINVLIVARLPNRLPEGRLTKGVVHHKVLSTDFFSRAFLTPNLFSYVFFWHCPSSLTISMNCATNCKHWILNKLRWRGGT